MATNDIGRVTPIWRGFYSAATTYELNDIVIDTSGSVWWHKSPAQTTGVVPEVGEIWDAVIDMSVFSGLIQAAITTAQTALEAAQAAVAEVTVDTVRAETAAQNAEASALSASESAASVGAYAQAAEQAKNAAQTAASQAAASASSAGTSAASAGSSAQAAETSKTAAQTAATQAAGSAETASGAAAVVEQKKTEAIAAIEAKGEEVLESIPEDYTELSEDVGELKTQLNLDIKNTVMQFDYTTDSGHSSENDKVKVDIQQGDSFRVSSANAMPYLSVYAHYSDGTSASVLSSNNAAFDVGLIAQKDIVELSVYFGKPSTAGTFTMLISYGIKRELLELQKRSEEVGTVRTWDIAYTSDSAHSSNKDKCFIDIKTGEKYLVSLDSELTGAIQIYEKYGNNQSVVAGNVTAKSDTLFTAANDDFAIGLYFGAQSVAGTAKITIRTGSEIDIYNNATEIENIKPVAELSENYFKIPDIEWTDNKFYNITKKHIDEDDGLKLAIINVAPFRGGTITGQTSIAPNSRYGIAFVDGNGGFIIGYPSTHTGYYDFAYELIVPENATYLYVSCRKATEDQWINPTYPWEYALSNLSAAIPDETTITNKDVYGNLLNARHVNANQTPTLSLVHFSDLHGDKSALSRIIKYADSYGANIADIICTGDMVEGEAEQIASWWDEKVLTCMGNHDTCDYEGGTYDWTALSMANRDAYYIVPFESNWNIQHTAGTSYYYKDYTTEKVRLIVMDGMLYTGASASGTEAAAQTAWLENLLSDAITNELHVLIAIHAPHGGATAEVCSFSKYNQGVCPSYGDCNTPQTVIDTVATKITAGLYFVGYIVGHTHQDNIWDAENDGKQLMYNITCAAVDTTANQWIGSDQYRDDQHDAFNIVTIDTANTLVKIVRGGGADIDDHMRTRKAICFNYSTGEKVGEIL